MNELVLNAPAKVNLMLDVGEKRADGFHEVSMILQAVELFDRVCLKRTEEEGITLLVKAPAPEGLANEDNLMVRAAKLLFDLFSLSGGIEMRLQKRIPVAAGLGGGSSDAAAVLFGMNLIYDLSLETDELEKIGSILGSDVPFFFRGGTELAKGRGEVLFPLPDIGHQPLVLVTPDRSVSTAEIYGMMDELPPYVHPDTEAVASRIMNGETKDLPFENVMENVTSSILPEIGQIKDVLLKEGAKRVLMSGSGPTVFGIFETEKEAENALIRAENAFPDAAAAKTHTFPYGIMVPDGFSEEKQWKN